MADITCDSDGKLDKFVSAREGVDFDPILPLHSLEQGSKYYLAMFLTGACATTAMAHKIISSERFPSVQV